MSTTRFVKKSITVGIAVLALVGLAAAPAHATEVQKSCTDNSDRCWTDPVHFGGGSVTGTVDLYTTGSNEFGVWTILVNDHEYCTQKIPMAGNARPISCNNLPAGNITLESAMTPGGGIHHLTLRF